MKKLLLATIVLLSVNSAFALAENDSSDCASLSTSTVVDSNVTDVANEVEENGNESSSQ